MTPFGSADTLSHSEGRDLNISKTNARAEVEFAWLTAVT